MGLSPTISPFPQVQALLARARAWDRLANETGGTAQRQLVEARLRAVAVEVPTGGSLEQTWE